ncbi:hypothetical protein D3C75_942330 [compost metagenome]
MNVGLHQFEFFVQRNQLIPILKIKATSQIMTQFDKQVRCLVGIYSTSCNNYIQRIVEKMRFDLRLKKGHLRPNRILYRGTQVDQRSNPRP